MPVLFYNIFNKHLLAYQNLTRFSTCKYVAFDSDTNTQVFFLTRHDGFLALTALRRILVGVAFGAEQLLILGGEGFVRYGAFTLEALEAVAVPVAVLVGKILCGIQHRAGCKCCGCSVR